MEYFRKFEIILVSADNLPNVRSFGQMRVYAEVSLNGESETTKKTSRKTIVDMLGETNPRWNFLLDYTINESSIVEDEGLQVVVKLYCERTMGDRYIGEVTIPVKSLFDSGLRAENVLSYDVMGTEDGRLNILYSFRDKFLAQKPWVKALEFGIKMLLRRTWPALTGDAGSW